MVRSPRSGISLAFLCLGLLGAMPILSNARPAGSDGLSFAIWLTFWQLLAALPLFLAERGRVALPLRRAWNGRTGFVAVATGAMFGLSTYLYVVTAERVWGGDRFETWPERP
ncbi:hypothetical protein SAMN06265365_1561 [Tistlia consotensis]|uniref:Uncharacterized protein n=1 Tax=Tistlia consotensis USBA 355 TaxID=560819 RepID=A0A1Y6CXS4_9PROT|nr:hypothetical protein [Tistlia consotensis]SMF84583.1 hypothetical protein SAMN05428998_1571 [Tistlia consotensis USBA 355]SNS37164.1 hypothetical protein SAMN06265365_1561 [Tistlia consotensis]